MLPNEILMIIIRYSGDAYAIFRTFIGLNQRLNNILVDKRLHLFSELLYTNIDNANIYHYYDSDSFQTIVQRISSLSTTNNDQQLRTYLRSFISSYIREIYNQSRNEFQSNTKQFQNIREHLTEDETFTVDAELKKTFRDLQSTLCCVCQYCREEPRFTFESIINMKRIEFLVLNKGARLQCDDNDSYEFNFARALQQLLLANVKNVRSAPQRFINPLIRMFKALICSNPMLLKNKAQTKDGTQFLVHYFLLNSIYQLQYTHCDVPFAPIYIYWYRGALDLLIFVLQCMNQVLNDELWTENTALGILNMITFTEPFTDRDIFIYTSQIEILIIILHEYIQKHRISYDEYNFVQSILIPLINNERSDIIRCIYSNDEYGWNLFKKSWNNEKYIKIMTGNSKKRQLLHALVDEKHLRMWLANTDLLFILLQKKECKLLKKLVKLLPSLVHQLDEDGNDPLLYVCLKVQGCRHRLVEFFIEMGCDLQRRNTKGENFIDALQLQRNRKLLENLIERETIQIDPVVGEVKVTFTKHSE